MPVQKADDGNLELKLWWALWPMSLLLAHLSMKCSRWAIVIDICPSSIVCPSVRQQFLQTTSPPRPMAWFHINFTETFLGLSSTKTAKIIPLYWTKWQPVLKNKKKLQMTYPPRPIDRFQNNFTEMFLGWPFTKIAKIILLPWTKWPPEPNIEKLLNDISS